MFFPLIINAMDVALWQVPDPPRSTPLWMDKTAEVNNINVHVSYLACDLNDKEILDFYQDQLEKVGWKLMNYFQDQKIMSFIKDKNYIYIAVAKMGENNKIYVVSSPADLRLCRTLKDYFFKDVIVEDAQGKDLPDVPRYPDSRRRLNIFSQEDGDILMYESNATPQEISNFYRERLGQYGWEVMRATEPTFLNRFPQVKDILKTVAIICFQRDEDVLVVTAYPAPKEMSKARTLISIVKNMGGFFNTEEK